MSLPASFNQSGFVTAARLRPQRGLLIDISGPRNSGKTEFGMSAPGPGMNICLDRSLDPVLDNPDPPVTRQADWAFQIVQVPKEGQVKSEEFLEYWKRFYGIYLSVINTKECRSAILDGDSDSWEIQRLAAFGKLQQIPSILYTGVNAARRAMYARAYDSRKIWVFTNKVKKHYEDVIDSTTGAVKLTDAGREVREWDGTWDRQGFEAEEGFWDLRLSAYYNEPRQRFGVKLVFCKVNMKLHGQCLEGDDCNLPMLLEMCYPQISLSEWGYK